MKIWPGDQLKCYFMPSQPSPAASWRQLSKTPMTWSAEAWVTSKVWQFLLINFCEQLDSVITSGLTPSDVVRCCRKCRLLCSLQGAMGKWEGGERIIFTNGLCFFLKIDSPPVIATSIRELLSLAHAHVGHCSRWTLVIHILYSTVRHLSRGHERLIASRHCNSQGN